MPNSKSRIVIAGGRSFPTNHLKLFFEDDDAVFSSELTYKIGRPILWRHSSTCWVAALAIFTRSAKLAGGCDKNGSELSGVLCFGLE